METLKNPLRLLKKEIVIIVALAFLLFLVSTLGAAAQADAGPAGCATWSPENTSSASFYRGFGVPWDVESENLLIHAGCGEDDVTLNIKGDRSTFYIYKYGYISSPSTNGWERITYQGETGKGNWLAGKAETDVPASLVPVDKKTYALFFTCEPNGNGFDCGCRNSSCEPGGYWKLQEIKRTGSDRENLINQTREQYGNTREKAVDKRKDALPIQSPEKRASDLLRNAQLSVLTGGALNSATIPALEELTGVKLGNDDVLLGMDDICGLIGSCDSLPGFGGLDIPSIGGIAGGLGGGISQSFGGSITGSKPCECYGVQYGKLIDIEPTSGSDITLMYILGTQKYENNNLDDLYSTPNVNILGNYFNISTSICYHTVPGIPPECEEREDNIDGFLSPTVGTSES